MANIQKEITLFDADDDDIDLFGDFDDLFNDPIEETVEAIDIDPELIRKSVLEFHQLFTGQEESLGVGAGAILLYQHLQSAGYQANVIMEDTEATVTASSSNPALKTALIDRVEDLLEEMIYMARDWKSKSFTVHSIKTHTLNDAMEISINFHAV